MNTHPLRIALGAAAVLAAALGTAACGSQTAIDPPETSVGDAPPSLQPAPSPHCTASADQIQRRLDAGQPACGEVADAPLGYAHVPSDHHPI